MESEWLGQIIDELRLVRGSIGGLEQGQARLEQGQARLEQGQAKLEQGQAKLEQRIDRVEQKLDAVYEQTAKISENHTEIVDKFEAFADFVRSKIVQYDEDIHSIKRKIR